MATTKAPLFGLDASGTLGGCIVFSKWKGRTYVRRHAVPSNPRSALQLGMRAVFKWITQNFGTLSDSQKAEWDDLAAPENITQLNAQVRDAQTRGRRNVGWRQGPDEAPGTTPDAPTNDASTPAHESVVLTWTRPAANKGDYCTVVTCGTVIAERHLIEGVRAVIDETLATVTITGLATGVTHYWSVREMNTDGEGGAWLDGAGFLPL